MYSVAKLSARRAGGWSRLQILFRLAASLSPADASLFHALTSLSPADASLFSSDASLFSLDASLFSRGASLFSLDASLFSSGASLFPITGGSIPIAEPKFIIPPSVRLFPSRSGGGTAPRAQSVLLARRGNLEEGVVFTLIANSGCAVGI
jgi:hypothetical protein